jgi:hypothetical protein
MLGDVNDNGEEEFTEIRTAHTTGRAGLRPQIWRIRHCLH